MDFVSKQNHLLQLSVRSVSRFEALESWIISQFFLENHLKETKKSNIVENKTQQKSKKTKHSS